MWKFVLTYGVMGFGPLTALLVLLFQIYRGETPTFHDAMVQSLLCVFVAGPIWTLMMWPKMKIAIKMNERRKQPQESK